MRNLLLALGLVVSGGVVAPGSVVDDGTACGTCGSYLWKSTDVPALYQPFATHAFTGSHALAGESLTWIPGVPALNTESNA